MISILSDNSEEEPKKTTDYKLDDLEMVKTIGTGKIHFILQKWV